MISPNTGVSKSPGVLIQCVFSNIPLNSQDFSSLALNLPDKIQLSTHSDSVVIPYETVPLKSPSSL